MLPSGSIVSLLGKSGCGKSTLLKAIAGLIPISHGSITFARNQIAETGNVSFVFQDATLLPWRTAIENVLLPLELQKGSLGESRKRATELLETVGLDKSAHTKLPSQLSGGMRMRASLARALITDPDVMLFDEPFAALDDILRTKLNGLLLDLWQTRPRTILFVTHNISEAVFLSHRIAIMGQGTIGKWVDIDLPHPRNMTTRSLPRFAELYGTVSAALEACAK